MGRAGHYDVLLRVARHPSCAGSGALAAAFTASTTSDPDRFLWAGDTPCAMAQAQVRSRAAPGNGGARLDRSLDGTETDPVLCAKQWFHC